MEKNAIILNYNQPKLSTSLACKLSEMRFFDAIIIVDNHSSREGRILPINIKNVRVFYTDKNGGYGYGNNFGVFRCLPPDKESLLFFFNPDVEVPRETLEKIETFCTRNPMAGAVSCARKGRDGALQEQYWDLPNYKSYLFNALWISRFWKRKRTTLPSSNETEVGVVPGSFFAISKKIFQSIGGFDEKVFLYCEENILSQKLFNAGYREYLLSDCYYYHNHIDNHVENFDSIKKHSEYYRKSKTYYYLSYLHPGFFLACFAKLVFYLEKWRHVFAWRITHLQKRV